MTGGQNSDGTRLSLLPTFTFRCSGSEYSIGATASKLMALLAIQDAWVDRSWTAAILWPHLSEARAAANLRTTVWRISNADVNPGLEASGASLRLSRSVAVDLHDATAAARDILQRNRDAIATLNDCEVRSLLEPLTSELLVNWYDEWLLVHQERWRQLRLHALDAVSEVLTDLGRWALAVDAATASVDAEPLRESGYRCLMQAHLAQGNLSEVIRTHRQYRDLLHRELGVRPSHHMIELLDAAIG